MDSPDALVALGLTQLLLPAYLDLVNRLAIAPEMGELWIMAWLMAMGIPPERRLDNAVAAQSQTSRQIR